MSDGDAVLPLSLAFIQDIKLQIPWEPTISSFVFTMLNLNVICHCQTMTSSHLSPSNTNTCGHFSSNSASSESNITGPGITVLRSFLWKHWGDNTTPVSGSHESGLTSQTLQSQLSHNLTFNNVLSSQFKQCVINGYGVKSCILWNKIKEGELPMLTLAKMGGHMCFAYNTNSICNSDCPFAFNHVPYLTAENYC